jgi:Ca-activated chloride channel family protein
VVLGLEKENFQVYEDKQLQSVQHFSSTDVPVSVGIIFDTSGSMTTKIDRAREAVVEFIKTANTEDEFSLITFANRPIDLVGPTTSPKELTNNLVFARPKGSTALLDAIYLGIAKMRSAKYTKKAMLIISDGGDNHSRYSEKDVKRLVKESDVTIYAIGVYDTYFSTQEERLGPELLSDICDVSGGRSFAVNNPNDLPDVASKIGVELRNQYVLGYRPSQRTGDGKWHKIRVKMLAPKGLPRLQVSAKQGYYARGE